VQPRPDEHCNAVYNSATLPFDQGDEDPPRQKDSDITKYRLIHTFQCGSPEKGGKLAGVCDVCARRVV